jgi:tetratricopeptide (TPR) repeat protein
MLYSKNKNYKKALESLEIAVQEDGGNKMALLEKANVLRKLGQDQEVFDIYDRFLAYYSADKKGSKDVLYRYRHQAMRRGLSQFRSGSYWQAIRYFDIVRKKFPSTNEGALASYWKGESYYRLAEDERIKETLRRSRFSRALTSYKRFLRRSSSSGKANKALFHMGEIYHKMGKNESAITYFNKVIQRNPQGGLAQQAKRWKRKLEEQIYRQGPWSNSKDSVDPTSETEIPQGEGSEDGEKPESSMKLKKDDPFTFDDKDESPSTSGASSNPKSSSSKSGLTEI